MCNESSADNTCSHFLILNLLLTCSVKENTAKQEIEPLWVKAPKGLFHGDSINLGNSRSAFQAIKRGTEEKQLFDMLGEGDMRPRKIGESLPDWFPLKNLDIEALPYVDKADF